MISKIGSIVVICAFAVFSILGTRSALAGDGQEIQNMRDSIEQLQNQLADQQRQLDESKMAQAQAPKDLGLNEDGDRTSSSALSSFVEAVDFDAWVAVNYAYNSRGSGNNHIIGQNSNTGFHSDSHTIQVDQLWFSMDKPVSKESRAGFHADIAFGETARNSNLNFGGNDSVSVYTAYASYLFPGGIGDGGIRVDAGELWTLLGAEVVPATENFNITRGIVWGLQPVTNTGVLVSTDVGPVSLALGLMNAPLSDTASDSDRNKAWTGQIALDISDDYSIATSFVVGSAFVPLSASTIPDPANPGTFFPVNNDNGKADVAIIDVVIGAHPIEKLELSFNYDYVLSRPKGNATPNMNTHAFAVAGRYALTDKIGAAGRFELAHVDPHSAGKPTDEYSVTITGDYSFNQFLTLRGEWRYDGGIDGKFAKSSSLYQNVGNFADHQSLFLAEVIYNF